MRSIHVAALSLVAFAALAFAFVLSALASNDDFAAAFWAAAGILALAASARMAAPKGAT